jgi:hypothetical protein
MQYKTLVLCASAMALAAGLACSKNPETPVSPSGSQPGTTDAGPDNSTLKATAPTPQSPVNNAQPDSLVLVAGKSTPTYGDPATPFAYEYEIKNAGGTTVCSGTSGGGAGSTVTVTPSCSIDFDQPMTWRMRASYQGHAGPWSANANFRSPSGGYIRGNEVFDPLTNGKTAGDISGPVQFIPGTGIQLLDHSSYVTYRLPQNLQTGELSMMVLHADEGNPGDKSKIFSMQEGPDVSDITDDDYRMTAELRGRDYGAPGSVTFRIIAGDGESRDGQRIQLNFSDSRWYFWKFTWRTGFAELQVREDGPSGQVIYSQSVGGWDHPYRPEPHYIHLGSPIGRAGPIDATQPGIIIKNVWASSRPRPAFPGE